MVPSEDKIIEAVRSVITETLRVSVDKLHLDSLLGEELGADSMDFVEIQFRLETDCAIEFYKGDPVETLSELLAPKKLEEDGVLTAFGAAVLRLRMPEVTPDRLEAGTPVAGIEAFYTPRTWVRLVQEITGARPQSCPQCGSTKLKLGAPSTLLCRSCKSQIRCPTGEECLAAWAKKVPALLESLNRSEAT